MTTTSKHIAIYMRVSSDGQQFRSQMPELERWAAAQAEPVEWYTDKYTGKTMDRPGWNQVEEQLHAGNVTKVVCWRLDRLGRTTLELCQLFDDLRERRVDLVSLTEGLSLATSAGRKFARDMASAAEYEREVRAERQTAGIAAARAEGKRWGGSKPGTRKRRVTPVKVRVIRQLHAERVPVTQIAQTVELSRKTVYEILAARMPAHDKD